MARGAAAAAWGVVWGLSLSRLLLAAAFPLLEPGWRLAAVAAAAGSDAVDGWVARRWGVTSWWGAAVDAGTDKLFTLTVLAVVTLEGSLAWWQLAALLPRDAVVLGLIACFAARGQTRHWRAIDHRVLGKLATGAQFALLLAVIVVPERAGVTLPLFVLAAGVTWVAAADYLLKLGPLALQSAGSRRLATPQ